ncbi:MAG: beta-phosphoglucomutase [Bacteroidales bacterium]|nr:beta-phosphoglucomutase [Bacteroidales bacterium]
MSFLKACIFDLDGVIVDTAKFHFLAWKKISNDLGFDIDHHFDEKIKGVGRSRCVDILLEHGKIEKSEQDKIQIADEKNALFLEYVSTITEADILPGVSNFLQQLDDNNIPFALGSASKNAPLILRKIGLYDRFKVIIDGNVISKAKPNPEVFLRGAQEMNILPQDCVVFEDAVNGVEAAKNGGFYCVGVGQKEILSTADICIESFTELSTWQSFNMLLK